ncbi:hypothetical protein HDU81_006133 [Chytriomyces hyalinus]|nr:hypothetical protein HDU81_006133 [Chytriomyces hyalinus]
MLISCVHGRDRRHLRQIGKRDLVAAVRFGTKTPGMPCRRTGATRWKYTFANIVYITDATSTREITSYVLPLSIAPVPLSQSDTLNHLLLKVRLSDDPSLCSSHTVLVVDMSGSMRTSDVDSFKTRADAVYATLALDFIGAQLDQAMLRGTDVVSLIEMRQDATIVFEREPITNHLFNMLLDHSTHSNPYSHGNYINAFRAAQSLFEEDMCNDTCALMLLFLSDGKPSDSVARGPNSSVQSMIDIEIKSMALDFGTRLTVGTIGFAKDEDFSVLNEMAKTATGAGCNGIFLKSDSCAVALSKSISRLTSSLSLTRTRLSSLGHAGFRGQLREVEKESFEKDLGQLSHSGWNVYKDGVQKCCWNPMILDWDYYDLKEPVAGFAVRKKSFGEGAERIVFQLVDFDKNHHILPKSRWVAKDSRFVHDDESKKMEFHQVFCETQMKAGDLAKAFNVELATRGGYKSFPRIRFLDCFVYVFLDEDDIESGLLVEKMLDQTKYKKWNGNDGSVDGLAHQPETVNLEELFDNLKITHMGGGSSSKMSSAPRALGSTMRVTDRVVAAAANASSLMARNYADFPQAFSHWTYFHSKRQFLVCDLQGCLDMTVVPPTFEFTDPAIHFSGNSKGGKRKFGRTNRGKYGIADFFKTHKCNDICRVLGLPSDND